MSQRNEEKNQLEKTKAILSLGRMFLNSDLENQINLFLYSLSVLLYFQPTSAFTYSTKLYEKIKRNNAQRSVIYKASHITGAH